MVAASEKTKRVSRGLLKPPRAKLRTLRDLPGTSDETEAVLVSTRTEARSWIRFGHAITAAGNDGAINVWKDDAGQWRCEFYQFQITKGSRSFKTLAAVDVWLSEWWLRMRRE